VRVAQFDSEILLSVYLVKRVALSTVNGHAPVAPHREDVRFRERERAADA